MSTTVIACSLVEAHRLLGEEHLGQSNSAPALARRLRDSGASAVCIVVEAVRPNDRLLAWIDTEHAQGWLASSPLTVLPPSNASDLFSSHLKVGTGKGFVVADAAVLAIMATTRDLRPAGRPDLSPDAAASKAFEASEGFKAVDALDNSATSDVTAAFDATCVAYAANTSDTVSTTNTDFAFDPTLLPQLSWDEEAVFYDAPSAPPAPKRQLDLYAIVDSAERLEQVLAAGVKTVQLRVKKPLHPSAAWDEHLRLEVQRSVAASHAVGAELFINDHWQVAAQAGAGGVHLGQEDLQALGSAGRAALQATGMAIGVSSHSLWELCRARTLNPRYIACGPVWPTLTKDMPWRAQGLDNLSWWCRMAGFPVVAIGGILGVEQVFAAASTGADGICIVRGLGNHPGSVVSGLQTAMLEGRASATGSSAKRVWPHPSLSQKSV